VQRKYITITIQEKRETLLLQLNNHSIKKKEKPREVLIISPSSYENGSQDNDLPTYFCLVNDFTSWPLHL